MNNRSLLRWLRRSGFVLLMVMLAVTARIPTIVEARQSDCNETFRAALNTALGQCQNLGMNQLCVGNPKVTVVSQSGAQSSPVARTTLSIDDVKSLALGGYEGVDWGIVMLRLLGNLPGNNPGAGVTMIAFGNVQVAAAPGTAPMQSFYLKTAGDPSCVGFPGDGVMIQSPRGQQKVQLVANGVQLSIGSTVFLNVEEADGTPRLKIRTLQGEVSAQFGDQEVLIEAGEESGIEIQDGDEEYEVEAVGELEEDHPFDIEFIEEFPIDELPEELSWEDLEAEWGQADDQEGDESFNEGSDEDGDVGSQGDGENSEGDTGDTGDEGDFSEGDTGEGGEGE